MGYARELAGLVNGGNELGEGVAGHLLDMGRETWVESDPNERFALVVIGALYFVTRGVSPTSHVPRPSAISNVDGCDT